MCGTAQPRHTGRRDNEQQIHCLKHPELTQRWSQIGWYFPTKESNDVGQNLHGSKEKSG